MKILSKSIPFDSDWKRVETNRKIYEMTKFYRSIIA